jgi:hypothetical protein
MDFAATRAVCPLCNRQSTRRHIISIHMNETLLCIFIALLVPAGAAVVIFYMERSGTVVRPERRVAPVAHAPTQQHFSFAEWKARLNSPFEEK